MRSGIGAGHGERGVGRRGGACFISPLPGLTKIIQTIWAKCCSLHVTSMQVFYDVSSQPARCCQVIDDHGNIRIESAHSSSVTPAILFGCAVCMCVPMSLCVLMSLTVLIFIY